MQVFRLLLTVRKILDLGLIVISVWQCIINNCQSVLFHLHDIRRIRKFLSYEITKSLVQAVIMSWIDYCNNLSYGVPAVHPSKLERLQNAAARPVSYMLKHGHINPLLFRLHWLPIGFIIDFKIAMLAFKYIYGLAPQYLSSRLTVREYSRYNLRSTDGVVLVDLSVRTKKTLGDRAFSIAAPKVWNNLPLHIRNEKNFDTFNKLLKNCYFKIAYNLVTWTYLNIFIFMF